MKRIMMLALLAACGVAQASEWVSGGVTPDGREMLVDVSSIHIEGDIREIWWKIDFRPDLEKGTGSHSNTWVTSWLWHTAIKCGRRRTRDDDMTIHYADGTSLLMPPGYTPDPTWKPVAPDSAQEGLMEFLCAWKPK
jgi:hypothetical protein